MVNKLDILKTLFDEFLHETRGQSVHRLEKDIKLNAQVFEFQAHVSQKLNHLKLNLILNPIIHSQSIYNSFDKDDRPFLPNDYCLAFFDFLNVHKNDSLELYELIDKFIEAHKEEFNWQDIVITASGATRCKTNLRFALNQLRGIGLIDKVNKEGKRILLPTLQGELVFFSWRKSIDRNEFYSDLFDSRIKHNIKIKEAEFTKLFKVLHDLTLVKDHGGNTEVTEFWAYKDNQEEFEKVQDLLVDIKKFLKLSIITPNGIILKDDKK